MNLDRLKWRVLAYSMTAYAIVMVVLAYIPARVEVSFGRAALCYALCFSAWPIWIFWEARRRLRDH
jgi:hypothetical protein